MDPGLVEASFRRGPDAPYQPDGKGVEEGALIGRVHRHQSVRLGHLRGHLGQVLGAGHADRQGQTDLVSHPSAEGGGDFGRRSEKVDGACHVEEGLVDRHPLDSRGEVMEHRHHLVAELLIAAEVAADEEEVAAELARPPAGHAGPNAVGPRLVGCRQHHAAAHGDGPFPQGRVQQLLDRRVEGVEVGVKDRRPARSRHHARRIVEHMFDFHGHGIERSSKRRSRGPRLRRHGVPRQRAGPRRLRTGPWDLWATTGQERRSPRRRSPLRGSALRPSPSCRVHISQTSMTTFSSWSVPAMSWFRNCRR